MYNNTQAEPEESTRKPCPHPHPAHTKGAGNNTSQTSSSLSDIGEQLFKGPLRLSLDEETSERQGATSGPHLHTQGHFCCPTASPKVAEHLVGLPGTARPISRLGGCLRVPWARPPSNTHRELHHWQVRLWVRLPQGSPLQMQVPTEHTCRMWSQGLVGLGRQHLSRLLRMGPSFFEACPDR